MTHKTVLFTGGGSAGHVTPNIALIRHFLEIGWDVHYAGTADGIEKQLIGALPEVTYHTISSGKLRRYFSLKNLSDPFRVIRGVRESKSLIRSLRPDVVFSKGGFVSVPVVMGAKNRAPVVIHESDYTPGLANRIAMRYADKVCVTFEDTLGSIPKNKGVFTGTPIRSALYDGEREKGLRFAGLSGDKPVLMVMGGSLGAQAVNEALRKELPRLLGKFDIVHLCGKGKVDETLTMPGYVQYEYVNEELPDLFAATDVVLSRAGANAVFEFLALKKPAVLVPLPLSASRGDQILNAKYFVKRGYATLLDQDTMTSEQLAAAIEDTYAARQTYIDAMNGEPHADGTRDVLDVIHMAAEGKRHG